MELTERGKNDSFIPNSEAVNVVRIILTIE
jgi:hypothetical protein